MPTRALDLSWYMRSGLAAVFFTALTFPTTLASQNRIQPEPQLLRRQYASSVTGQQREYLLYLPQEYEDQSERKWPVILFLHGGAERGDGREDLDYVLRHGPLMEAWIQHRDLPFIMVSPQLPVFDQVQQTTSRQALPKPKRLETPPPREPPFRSDRPIARAAEAKPDSWDPRLGPPAGWWKVEDDVISILDEVLEDYRADADRVYLTGLAYGGFGTFYMAAAHPNRWAAIAPIVGMGDVLTVAPLAERDLPIWIFGGGRDRVVLVGWLHELVQALEEAGHTAVRFTVHKDLGHDAWKRVYAGQDLYDWFLLHVRQ